jgi:hypothetical protein
MGVGGQGHSRAALCTGTHCIGGWVGLRAGLETEVRGKVLCPCRGTNSDRPVVQSVARHYTDWATPAHVYIRSVSQILSYVTTFEVVTGASMNMAVFGM